MPQQRMQMEMDTVPVGLETRILIFSPLYKHSLTLVCFILCWALGLLTGGGEKKKKGKPRNNQLLPPALWFLFSQTKWELRMNLCRRHWLLNPSCLSDALPGTPNWLKARTGIRLLFHLCWWLKTKTASCLI